MLETSMGDIQLELYWEHAPRVGRDYLALHRTDPLIDYRAHQTCKNFAELAKRGYYNGVIFHRIIAVRGTISALTHAQPTPLLPGLHDPDR